MAAIVLSGTLSGCDGIHLMAGSDHASGETVADARAAGSQATAPGDVITGAIAPSGTLGYAGSAPADWDIIRSTVLTSLSSTSSAHVEWANPTTGNSGTISELATASARNGRECRTFASTIAGIDGVRLYHAELCKSVMDTWEFDRIVAADTE